MNTSGKARVVGAMFERIAPRYDLLNRLMSLGLDRSWRRRVVREARPAPGRLALDIGTGTGDLALALARDGRAQHVAGADLSAGMLQVAKHKAESAGVGARISLLQADVAALPFGDGAFDCITTAFMVRNLGDLDAALREMYRVLSDGGRLVVLEITRPAKDLRGRLFSLYFGRIVPVIGGWISGDATAYTYLPASVDHFISAEELAASLTGAGFEGVSFHRLGPGPVALHVATRVSPGE